MTGKQLDLGWTTGRRFRISDFGFRIWNFDERIEVQSKRGAVVELDFRFVSVAGFDAVAEANECGARCVMRDAFACPLHGGGAHDGGELADGDARGWAGREIENQTQANDEDNGCTEGRSLER